jgi:hypothetical protein
MYGSKVTTKQIFRTDQQNATRGLTNATRELFLTEKRRVNNLTRRVTCPVRPKTPFSDFKLTKTQPNVRIKTCNFDTTYY